MTFSRPRLIARLDVKGASVVKGIQLDGLRVVGSVEEKAKSYFEQGADEILIMDAVATLYRNQGAIEAIRLAAESTFVPITVGGGIRSLEDAKSMFQLGVDRVAVNSSALADPRILRQLSDTFGEQAVVLSIEAKKVSHGNWSCFFESGREDSGKSVMNWIQEAATLGVGEILLTSVDRDGLMKGADLELISEVVSEAPTGVVYSGGLIDPRQILEMQSVPNLCGVAIASAFHYGRLSISDLKARIKANWESKED